jgi:hypothetical protein
VIAVTAYGDTGIPVDARLSPRERPQSAARASIVASRLIVLAVALTILVRGFMAFWSGLAIAPVSGGTLDWADRHVTPLPGFLILVIFLEYPAAVFLGIHLLLSANRVRRSTPFRSAVPVRWPAVLTVLYVVPSLATVGEHGASTVVVLPLILVGSAVALGLVLYARHLLPEAPEPA